MMPMEVSMRANPERRVRKGATSIEYALIACVISAAIVASIQTYAGSTRELYDFVATVIGDAL